MTIPNNRASRAFFPPTLRRRLLTGRLITYNEWQRLRTFKGWWEDIEGLSIERDEGFIALDRKLFDVTETERADRVIQDIFHIATEAMNRVEIPIEEFEQAQAMSAQEILDSKFCEQVLEIRKILGPQFFYIPPNAGKEDAMDAAMSLLEEMRTGSGIFRNPQAFESETLANERERARQQEAEFRRNAMNEILNIPAGKPVNLPGKDDSTSKPAPKDPPKPFSLIELE